MTNSLKKKHEVLIDNIKVILTNFIHQKILNTNYFRNLIFLKQNFILFSFLLKETKRN